MTGTVTVARRLPTTCFATLIVASTGIATAADGAADGDSLEPVLVVAPLGVTREPDRVPADAQRASADQIDRLQALDLTDFLNRSFGSININHAQNNPLQPDFNFRGFTASPLLGLPQGLSVYQNGARINEPFGDTVSWDLIASSAIQDVQLLAGANPVFGLNTLGGAMTLRMKDGFSYQGSAAEMYAGSFSRFGATVQSGGNNGRWGYYVNADYFEEDGWRDFSASDATSRVRCGELPRRRLQPRPVGLACEQRPARQWCLASGAAGGRPGSGVHASRSHRKYLDLAGA